MDTRTIPLECTVARRLAAAARLPPRAVRDALPIRLSPTIIAPGPDELVPARANDYDGLPSSSSSSSTPSASSRSTPPSRASKARAAGTDTMISERSSCPCAQRRRSGPRQPYRYPTGGSPRFASLPRYRRPASGRPTASGPALRLGPGRRHAHSFLQASRLMCRAPPRSWRGARRSFRPRGPPATCRPCLA